MKRGSSSPPPGRRRSFGQVYQHRGRWFVKYPNGRRTASGRTSYDVRRVSSEAKGRAFLRELRTSHLRGTLQHDGPSVAQGAATVAQAVAAYIDSRVAVGRSRGTIQQYRITLKAIRHHGLSARAATRATPDDIRAYLAWRRGHVFSRGALVKGAASNAVLFRDRGLLSATYEWLVREGRAPRNPVRMVRSPRKRQTARRPLELEEVAALLAACHPHRFRPMVLTGLYAGLACEELIRLRWRDVALGQRSIYVVRKKNQRAAVIPLHAHLAAELRVLQEHRARTTGIPTGEQCVFLSRYGRPYRQFPRQAWTGAIARAGLEGRDLTPHSLRRTFATYFEGQDRDLQAILGHADLTTTLIYRRARDDRARAGVEAIDYGLTSTPAAHPTPPARRNA